MTSECAIFLLQIIVIMISTFDALLIIFSCAVMLIQKGANVNTNVITIPSQGFDEAPKDSARWKLRSSIVPPPKPTCEPVFKVYLAFEQLQPLSLLLLLTL